MNEQFIYFTLNSATKATAKLNGEVGYDIIPSIFVQELTYIENLGVTDIDIRINSCGGSVVDGMTLFNAIFESKANITTYNVGLAASTAGWLFLAGKKCVIWDYATLMMHNPYGSDGSKSGNDMVERFRNAIITILAARSGQPELKIEKMMNDTTWLNAEEAVAMGFATRIEKTGVMVRLDNKTQSTKQMLKISNSALQIMENTENKEEVTPLVENTEVTQVENIAEADKAPETKEAEAAKVAEPVEDVEKTALTLQKEELVRQNHELTQELAKMKTALNAFEAEKAAKEAEALKVKVTGLVSNAITEGRITEASREVFEALANKSFELAENTLKGIPAAQVRPAINVMELANKYKNLPTTGDGIPDLKAMKRTDPQALNKIMVENKTLYGQMYKNAYGAEWLGGPQGL